jgi:hypothetical protein
MEEREIEDILRGDGVLREAVRLREQKQGRMPEELNERVLQRMAEEGGTSRWDAVLMVVRYASSLAAAVLVGLFVVQQVSGGAPDIEGEGRYYSQEELRTVSTLRRLYENRTQPKEENTFSYTRLKQMYHERH